MHINAYIENKFLGKEEFKKTNILSPLNGTIVAEFYNLDKNYVKKAYSYAKKIQKNWKDVDANKKIKIFKNFVELLQNEKNRFVELMMVEIAKSKRDCEAEVDRTIDLVLETITHYIELLNHVSYGDLNKGNKRAFFIREPLGLVLCISPFNYPLNLAMSKIVPSLITGNTVVFKSATQGTSTGSLIVQLLYKAGLMPGALQFVTGKGSEIGNDLVQNENINLINFTGSYDVGYKMAKLNPMAKKIFELSGKDPAIILEDANLEKSVQEIIKGAYSYSGQRCTAIKRVIVDETISKKLTELLKLKVEKFSVSKDVSLNPDIVPLIDKWTANESKELIKDALEKGAKLIIGNKFEDNLVYPTILFNVTKEMRIYSEEQFAPILPIIVFKSIKEAIEISNSSTFGLGGSVFTNNYHSFMSIANHLETGRITWNGASSRGPDNFPFTGVKHSGIGIQGAKDVLYESTYPKGFVLN